MLSFNFGFNQYKNKASLRHTGGFIKTLWCQIKKNNNSLLWSIKIMILAW